MTKVEKFPELFYGIQDAHFVLSAPTVSSLPKSFWPEVAFIGRSNTGKSSFLNWLVAHKTLSRTSKTPGRTAMLNCFAATLFCNFTYTGPLQSEKPRKEKIQFHGIDLPGYGYAKGPKVQVFGFSQLILDYLQKRKEMRGVFHLIDCRRKPTQEDIQLSQMIKKKSCFYFVIFTKSDKLSLSALKPTIKDSAAWLGIDPEKESRAVSILSGEGRKEILAHLWEGFHEQQ